MPLLREKSNIAQHASELSDIGQTTLLTCPVLWNFPNTTLLSGVQYIVIRLSNSDFDPQLPSDLSDKGFQPVTSVKRLPIDSRDITAAAICTTLLFVHPVTSGVIAYLYFRSRGRTGKDSITAVNLVAHDSIDTTGGPLPSADKTGNEPIGGNPKSEPTAYCDVCRSTVEIDVDDRCLRCGWSV